MTLKSNSDFGVGCSKNLPLENQEKKFCLDNLPNKDFFSELRVKQSKETLSPREVILSLLRAKNWKQVQLAEKIGLSRQALNNYLRGFWSFPTSIKIKIAQAFQVDSSVIWSLEK